MPRLVILAAAPLVLIGSNSVLGIMSDKIRVIMCTICRTLEVVDAYDGPEEHDQTLLYIARNHVTGDGRLHPLNVMIPDIITREGVKRPATHADWANKDFRAYLESQLTKAERPGEAVGLGTKYYEAKNTLLDDAMHCWRGRLKPETCGDYKSNSKRLVPDTSADRKELGLAKPTSSRFLCEFCPVHVGVTERQNRKAGLYK